MSTFSMDKLVIRICGTLFSLALFVLPATIFGAFWLANSDLVKSQLVKSRVYEAVSLDLVNQSAKDISINIGNSAVSADSIKSSVQKIATPGKIQQKTEEYIDHNYAWLNNKKAKPMIMPDITNERQQLADEISKKTGVSAEQIDNHLVNSFGANSSKDINTKIGLPMAVSNGGADSAGYLIKIAYWWLKHGLMTILSIILIIGAIVAAKSRSIKRWLSWSGRLAIGSAVSLAVAVVPVYIATQTELLANPAMPKIYRSVVAVLTQPIINTVIATLVVYVFFGLFAIMTGAKKGMGNGRKTDKYSESGDEAISHSRESGSFPSKSF